MGAGSGVRPGRGGIGVVQQGAPRSGGGTRTSGGFRGDEVSFVAFPGTYALEFTVMYECGKLAAGSVRQRPPKESRIG